MTSDDQERMAIDKVALELLGWTDLEYNGVLDFRGRSPAGTYFYGTPSPSLDAAFVVPLVEALRAKGWPMGEISWDATGFTVSLERIDGPDVRAEGATMQEALAKAAARAVEAVAARTSVL